MATAKKVTKPKPAAVAPTVDPIIKQAYIVSAHAHIAASKIEVGDKVRLINFISSAKSGPIVTDRVGTPLPAGCTLGYNNALSCRFGDDVEFRGINADGDAMVRIGSSDHPTCYNFIRATVNDGQTEKGRVKLNDSYTASLRGDCSTVAVGCQTFKMSAVRELVAKADAAIAADKAAVAKRAVAPKQITAKPAATYVPKAVTRAVVKVAKTPAKKALK